jgi:hypothetical protein
VLGGLARAAGGLRGWLAAGGLLLGWAERIKGKRKKVLGFLKKAPSK